MAGEYYLRTGRPPGGAKCWYPRELVLHSFAEEFGLPVSLRVIYPLVGLAGGYLGNG